MAVRIPTYERHVQLDAGAQTLPRYTANTEIGRGLSQAGNAMIQVAAHWKKKQEQFDTLQMHQNEALLRQQIQQIIVEETAKFDPGRDRPGTLHDNIMDRTNKAVAEFKGKATPGLEKEYDAKGTFTSTGTSDIASGVENKTTNKYVTGKIDAMVGDIYLQVEKNPDSNKQAVQQIRDTINSFDKLGGLTTAQKRILERGYLEGLPDHVVKGYQTQGRNTEAKTFVDGYIKDRKAEEPNTPDATPNPKTAPTDKRSEGPADTKLNQKRIAEIDKQPEIAAAIEKVAAETGRDPNMLKVAASIESGGDPNQVTGKHTGLFQLTSAEMGMNGKNANIKDPEANTRAFVAVLDRNEQQLTQALGRPPTAQELYMSHNQGVGGTVAHIQNPDQPAWKTMLSTGEGQEKGEEWAKAAVKGNVPGDVLRRLYNGDATQVTSSDLMAIKGTQVAGGSIDEAVTNARLADREPANRTVVASATGTVLSDTNPPPSYVGGMNVGSDRPPSIPTLQGYRASREMTLDEAAAHGYEGRGALAGIKTQPWLIDTVRQASKVLPEGYTVKVISTVDARPTTHTPWHPSGRAIDIQIYDDKGNKVPNVGPKSVPGWDVYENMAAAAKAYQQEKYPDQKMTWGGHFNTGTPYDRMHFQVGGVSARDFTPEQVEAGAAALKQVGGPIQVAQAGNPLSRWDQLGTSLTTKIDGNTMKGAAIEASMKKKLTSVLDSDTNSRIATGKPVELSPDLKQYFGTDKLTFDFVSNKLGTGNAITWQENTEYADRVYQSTAHMEQMPLEAIHDRLDSVKPQEGSPDYTRQTKVYDATLKHANEVVKQRNQDPAGYVDQMPDVKTALEAVQKNPNDAAATQTLITARMKAQQYLNIPQALQTPLSVNEAKQLGAPLLDRARADPENAGAEVAKAIIARVGNNPDLAHRALTTILRQKDIKDTQAKTAAAALSAELAPKVSPLTPSGAMSGKSPPEAYDEFGIAAYATKDGYLPTDKGYGEPRPDDYPPFGGPTFSGALMDANLVKQLRNSPQDATLLDKFDKLYGSGAAANVLSDSDVAPTAAQKPANVFTPPPVSETESFIPPEDEKDPNDPFSSSDYTPGGL